MEKSIDMFVQQMTKIQSKGKHIALDTSVQVSFMFLLFFSVRDCYGSQNNFQNPP